MAEDPVIRICGIGKMISEALKSHGVTTVGQLAKLEDGEFGIPNLPVLIGRAKAHVKANSKSVADPADSAAPLIVLGGTTTNPPARTPLPSIFATKLKHAVPPASGVDPAPAVVPPPEVPVVAPIKKSDEDLQHKFLISDHTWYEARVVVPRKESLCEAIVYELVVEPHDRVAFVCTWVSPTNPDEDEKDSRAGRERLHTMTYSAQLVLHFNSELPPLNVSIREEDYNALPNRYVLTNVLWEVEMMQRALSDS